jgi:hypothetical protein
VNGFQCVISKHSGIPLKNSIPGMFIFIIPTYLCKIVSFYNFLLPVRVREEGIVVVRRPISNFVGKLSNAGCCTHSMLGMVFVVQWDTAVLRLNFRDVWPQETRNCSIPRRQIGRHPIRNPSVRSATVIKIILSKKSISIPNHCFVSLCFFL